MDKSIELDALWTSLVPCARTLSIDLKKFILLHRYRFHFTPSAGPIPFRTARNYQQTRLLWALFPRLE